MAFISKEDPVVLNIMLTSKGRERLSTGNLTFSYFTIGDSEIDYNFIREVEADSNTEYSAFNSNILRPKDLNPTIISYIPQNITGSSYNNIETLSTLSYDVVNTANELGFFTDTGTTYITEATHVKRAGLYVEVSGLTGGTSINVYKLPTSHQSVNEPNVHDYIYIRWAYSGNSTGDTVNADIPIPNLTYRIVSKTGTLGGGNLVVELDRNLPDLSQLGFTGTSGAMIFYSGLSETNIMPTDYLEESVLNFLSNYQCGIANYPFWNMSIIFTEEIAGIQVNDRKFTQFDTRGYGGFVSYIQNQAPLYKKLGVIHYSNNSPANTYGEELQLDTPKLEIPTIMWHKSTSSTLGLTLIASGGSKMLTGETKSLNISYYDLIDEDSGVVVGKIFNGLKLFVIEDQELLYAMSYKSNRSWTLPNFSIGTAGSSPCSGSTVYVSAPALVQTDVACNEVQLDWTTSTSSTGAAVTYVLYRKDNIYDSWSIVVDGHTGTTYTESGLTNNITYYYKVIAVDANNIQSDDSNIVSFNVRCNAQPTTPVMNEVAIGSRCSEFYLSWSASTDDFPPITYTLYRKDDIDNVWNDIAFGLTSTEYSDSGLTDSYTYSYKVIAVDANNIQSVESNIVSRTVNCFTLAPNPMMSATAPTINEELQVAPKLTTTVVEDSIEINDVKITIDCVDKRGVGIFKQDNLLNESVTLLMAWSLSATVTSKPTDAVNSINVVEYSVDGGLNWIIGGSILVSALAGKNTVTNTKNGVFKIPNITNVDDVRIRITPEFEVDTKSGNGSVAITDIVSNSGRVSKTGFDRYTRINLDKPTLDTVSIPKLVYLNSFYLTGNDGGQEISKTSCVVYSQPMSVNESYCLHLNTVLSMADEQIGSGSYACVTITRNSLPMMSACIDSNNDQQSIDTSFMVQQGELVEIYNKAYSSDVNLSGNVVSSTSISQIQEIEDGGLFVGGNTCQSVCSYSG